MFPITIPTLVTEEVYQRFAWSVFLRGKIFLLNLFILIGILALYLTFLPENLRRFSFFIVLFTSLIIFPVMYFGTDFQIKKAYQKTPFWKDMEQTLIFEKDKFSVKSKRGEFLYSYDDIVKVFHTKDDFYIMLGPNVGFPIEKKNCSPEALEFLLELHIEHM
ncbi:YcxB family protein [Streptococcus sp. Marseille-P6264]|uniref:YcxB family protein n=1 Tax=Streptococcus sp. Marseille-P6264 TaxID=2487315 RepID=UPI0011E7A3AA|nr:YcxB family protein [Streptococcus sp. Marseille-P6264]